MIPTMYFELMKGLVVGLAAACLAATLMLVFGAVVGLWRHK